MADHCHSCGGPLAERPRGASPYCAYCADPQGNLHPRDQVQGGIARWLMTWQPGITEAEAWVRAGHYMQAMPAWAGK